MEKVLDRINRIYGIRVWLRMTDGAEAEQGGEPCFIRTISVSLVNICGFFLA